MNTQYNAHPATPEDCTVIEFPSGEEIICEGFGDNHKDYTIAKYLALQLNKGEMTETEVKETCNTRRLT